MADIPKSIGRYEVQGILGKGAMGVVYKAVDPAIDRIVAIKTIRLSLSEEELAFYEARFAQEIRTVGKLNHPNIVTIFDVGRTDDFAYMAMEFIDGPELKALMPPGKPLHVPTSLDLVAQVADGLGLAHSRGIIHRDVKPSNVMIAFDEDRMVAKVADFGIARGATSAVKTMTGMILGSPRYMSPEHLTGKKLDARSDIFSLGVVLYEMLAGAAPFDGESVSTIMYQTVHEPEPPLSRLNASIPSTVERVVARAMAKNPEERYASMKDFARDIRELLLALPAPLARLEAGESAAAAVPTAPPMSEAGKALAAEFDSLAATMRLAQMTAAPVDVTRMTSIMKAPTTPIEIEEPPGPEAEDPQHPAEAPSPAAPAAAARPSAGAQVDDPPAPLAFPVAPAAVLGLLALVAVGLGIALVL
jgi:serine/threonine-protein kinase